MTGPPSGIGGGRNWLTGDGSVPATALRIAGPLVLNGGQPPTVLSGAIGTYQMLASDTIVVVTGLTAPLTITLPPNLPPGAQCQIQRQDNTYNAITIAAPAGDTIPLQSTLALGRYGDALRFSRVIFGGGGVWVWESAFGAEDYSSPGSVALVASGAATLVQMALPDASRSIIALAVTLNAAITAGTLTLTLTVGGVQVGGNIAVLSSASNPSGIYLKSLGFQFATTQAAGGIVAVVGTGAGPLAGATAAVSTLRLL